MEHGHTAHFTKEYQQALICACEEASALHQSHIGTEHLLLGLLRQGNGSVVAVLNALDVTLDAVRKSEAAGLRRAVGAVPAILELHPDARRAMHAAITAAQQENHPAVDSEHLLLGLLQDDANGAARVLRHQGVSPEQVRAAVLKLLDDQTVG
jgi:ATP-dependent Clp protease ATP-binding subunit ClpA